MKKFLLGFVIGFLLTSAALYIVGALDESNSSCSQGFYALIGGRTDAQLVYFETDNLSEALTLIDLGAGEKPITVLEGVNALETIETLLASEEFPENTKVHLLELAKLKANPEPQACTAF